jgi:subtilisin family serine protease
MVPGWTQAFKKGGMMDRQSGNLWLSKSSAPKRFQWLFTGILSFVLWGVSARVEAQSLDPVRYVVTFLDSVPSQPNLLRSRNQTQLAQKNQEQIQKVARELGAEVEIAFPKFGVAIMESLPIAQGSLLKLQSTNRVVIEQERFFPAPKLPLYAQMAHRINQVVPRLRGTSHSERGEKTPYGVLLVNAPAVWNEAQYGRGVRVLVLDSGVDRDHPALSGNYEKGRNFMNDNNGPYPEFDSLGHGTHVAGTLLAQMSEGGFTGVAPQATLLAGRVCGELGCSSASIVAGILWAVEEGVDVVNMSLGGPFSTLSQKIALEKAELAGVTVVAASGNDGQGQVSYPAAHSTVLAVGAVNANSEKAPFSNWGPDLDVMAPGVAVMSSVPVGSGREAVVEVIHQDQTYPVAAKGFLGGKDVIEPVTASVLYAGLGRPENFSGKDFRGKFALIQRGEITFVEKVKNALAANAAGVVFFNNQPGLVQGSAQIDGQNVSIPVVMIEKETGEALVAAQEQQMQFSLKLQTLVTDYAAFDGTSMASPHAAGVVALLKARFPNAKPAQIRQALKVSAKAIFPNDQNQTGSGLIDAAAAMVALAEILKGEPAMMASLSQASGF